MYEPYYFIALFVPNYCAVKRYEVTSELRKLHNEDLNDTYCSPTIFRVTKSRRMRWVRHVARMEERRGVYGVVVWKPEGKRPRGRPRRR
jgi:hypothetical protein